MKGEQRDWKQRASECSLVPTSSKRCLSAALGLSIVFFALDVLGRGATGDFDGDGRDELLLRHQGNTAWVYYDIEDGVGRRQELTLEVTDADRFAALADLNGDGRDDVLMRAYDTHAWSWHVMGERAAERRDLRSLTRNPLFTFQAAGDFDGDGDDDVLLRNSSTGQFIYYESRLDAANPQTTLRRGLGLTANLLFEVIATGDLNGDGRDDVLMRHARLGHWIHYEMSRERGVLRRPSPRFTQNLLFEFAGIGDLDGDGDDDLLLRNIGSGEWIYYAMRGTTGELVQRFGMPHDLRHDAVAVADFDGDGRGTALLRHPDSGDWIAYEVGTTESERSLVSGITWDLAWVPTLTPLTYDRAIFCGGDDEIPSYVGRVEGYTGNLDGLEVILTGPGALHVAQPDSAGCFAFHAAPRGEYAVKVNADGHQTSPARTVKLPLGAVYDAEAYAVQRVASDPFRYRWEEDQTTPAGAEYSSHIVQPRVVEFQGTVVEVADAAAAERLRQHYNVLLVGEDWSQEHAYRLLTTMESIPQDQQDPGNDHFLPASAWRLTDEFIDGDITITTAEDGTRDVTVSTAAFVNATPRIATVDGKRGVWFSRRLHHAAVRFVTDNGTDESAYERIFDERYGVTTVIDDYPTLTAPTGHESHHNFQKFHAEEILLLINMLEEMPTGVHKVEGMRYLVRRLNGLEHPWYPGAPAVAWTDSHYVEFMESAFKGTPEDYIHRLILHEKAHFLWAHLFDDRLKEDWIELGGWYEDASSSSGWYTTKSAEFVSAYAHAIDPNEDMAETISHFVVNPDRLRARSMAKYEFVRDRIMQGAIYVARIREDLTFEVYNLFPDYVYPGKIRAIDITVEGAPHEDKTLTVEVELHALDPEKEGAHGGQTRISSEVGTFFDLSLYPVDEHGDGTEESTRLRGTITLSKYVKAGYWLSQGISLDDVAGNSRYSSAKDFGWRMYVDNPLEDVSPPAYVPGSLTMGTSLWEEDDTVQVIRVNWSFEEDTALVQGRCDAYVIASLADVYSYDGAGPYDDDRCTSEIFMPNYMPSSTYSTVRIEMHDVARNWGGAIFTGDESAEPPASVEVVTTNPDTEPPEIDINRIWVDAEPTHPTAPNGETRVTVRVRYRDNISGVYGIWMYLRDPQGGTHYHYVYLHYLDGPDGEYGIYPSRDPTRWASFERVVILPPGSLPGIWGIVEMIVEDRAKNLQRYNFVEIVHFEVDDG